MVDYSNYFPIAEYYRKVVMPLDKRFALEKKGKFVCCLHDDVNPSLGIVKSKAKGELYHCFGCNSWGTVVDLHKRVMLRYFKKTLDDEQAIRELCDIFGVRFSDVPRDMDSFDLSKVADKSVRKELALQNALNSYSVSDFRNDIIEGKMEGRGIGYYNTLLVKMISERKKSEE